MDFKEMSEMRYFIEPAEEFCRPMEYTAEEMTEVTVIAQGFYEGLNYYVKNINGRHPTAYVEIPQGHKAYGKEYEFNDEYPIEVHGGVTYNSDGLSPIDPKGERGHQFVGWDYGHAGDFAGYYLRNPKGILFHSKRWTTEEIVGHCKSAIDQINKLEGK